MKKLLFVLLALCLVLTGCSNQSSEVDEPVIDGPGSTWDAVEYATIEEMNNAAKTNIVSAAIAGKTDESFVVISNSIAQYKFVANGENWCIRASKDVDNDISGLHYESISFEKDTEATYYNDDVYMHRFFYDNTQYIITLDVKDKDISTAHFDDVSAEFQTNITGVKAGYESEVIEDGDTVIYKVTFFNSDGTSTVSETHYKFDGDTMVSIVNKAIFETEDAAKAYLQELLDTGNNADKYVLDGNTISVDMSDNVDFYNAMTKADFIADMKKTVE